MDLHLDGESLDWINWVIARLGWLLKAAIVVEEAQEDLSVSPSSYPSNAPYITYTDADGQVYDKAST